jgi:hypothetical protein
MTVLKTLALGFVCGALVASGPLAVAGPVKPPLTFPPTDDCSFLDGPAQQRCVARRSAMAAELAKVRSGEIKTLPPMLLPDDGTPSSGGGFKPLATPGSLGGLGESSTIPPSQDGAPNRSAPYDPNSIGNPWAGTPFSNGTGIHPLK